MGFRKGSNIPKYGTQEVGTQTTEGQNVLSTECP